MQLKLIGWNWGRVGHIDDRGIINYYDHRGRLHSDDGPALIHPNGVKEFWIHGRLQRIIDENDAPLELPYPWD